MSTTTTAISLPSPSRPLASSSVSRLPRRWKTRHRLYFALVLMWLGMIALVVIMALQQRAASAQERQEGLRNLVSIAASILDTEISRASTEGSARIIARDRALRLIGTLRFDTDNYIFAFDEDAKILSHPRRERGDDMSGLTDSNGIAIYPALIEVANRDGSGFVEYLSRTADGEELERKLSYVTLDPATRSYIAAGVYIDDLQHDFAAALLRSALILLLVGGIVSLFMLLLIRSISQSLGGEPEEAAKMVARIATGDLSANLALRRGDSASLLFHIQRMREQLIETIGEIHAESDRIDLGAREISSGSTDLSSRTEEQAASLEQTAASMDQLTATVRQNAESARLSSEIAQQASDASRKGRDAVQQMVGNMAEISAGSKRINEIIGLIDGIAFQTNLLALNASVEAARAGEHGRGFAVVAEEVRGLAGRSANAARDIKTLIGETSGLIDKGASQAESADQRMQAIFDAITQVESLISGISAASEEQRQGIEQVNQAIGQMDQVTQQNAALVEQATAAAAALENRTTRMREAVGRFRLPDASA